MCELIIRWWVYMEEHLLYEQENVVPEGEDLPVLEYTFLEEGTYKVVLEVCNCCGCCKYEQLVYIGPLVYVHREDCLKFTLYDKNVYEEDVYVEVNLYNVKNERIVQDKTTKYRGNSTFEIDLPYDGIFIVEIITRRNDLLQTLIDTKTFVLYEFCTVLDCYRELLMNVNCKDCKDCIDDKQEFLRWMYQLDQFVVNVFAFSMSTAVYYGVTNNFFYFEEKYLAVLQDIDFYLENLLRLCDKCRFIKRNPKIPSKCTPKITVCCGK